MKVVFLDFDVVLNSAEYRHSVYESNDYCFEPVTLEELIENNRKFKESR